MIYVSNAFALSMVEDGTISVATISAKVAKSFLSDGFESVVGHSDIARIVSNLLDLDIPMNRVNLSLKTGDVLIVAQYVGPRLPEGSTALPEGSKIVFKQVVLL